MSIDNPSICMIDDEGELLEGLSDVLCETYKVRTFTSAIEALEAFDKGFRPAVIVSDLRMPKMNGFEFVDALHARNIHEKVIIASGHADKASTIKALNMGVDGFLEKPFTVTQLRELLGKVQTREKKTHSNPDLVASLSRLNQLYFERLTRAENFIYDKDLKYPPDQEGRRQFIEKIREEEILIRQISAASSQSDDESKDL